MLKTYALLMALPALLLIGWWRLRCIHRRRLAQKRQQARREAELGLVDCFTCGLKIPRDRALEKKGRYFCGVKKSLREIADNNPAGGD